MIAAMYRQGMKEACSDKLYLDKLEKQLEGLAASFPDEDKDSEGHKSSLEAAKCEMSYCIISFRSLLNDYEKLESDYQQLKSDNRKANNQKLKNDIQKLETENQELKNDNQKLKDDNEKLTAHNSRNAGRKQATNDSMRETIIDMYYNKKTTLVEISKAVGVSYGVVQGIVKNVPKTNKE